MKKRILCIEGMRGIGAIIVALCHFMQIFFMQDGLGYGESRIGTILMATTWNTPFNILYNGNFAVCLFFVITGYVFTEIQYNENKVHWGGVLLKHYFKLLFPLLISAFIIRIFIQFDLFRNIEVGIITNSKWFTEGQINSDDFSLFQFLIINCFDVFFLGDCTYNQVFWMMKYSFYGTFLCVFVNYLCWPQDKIKSSFFYTGLIIVFAAMGYKNDVNTVYFINIILGIVCCHLYHSFSKCIKDNNKQIEVLSLLMIVLGIFFGGYPFGGDNTYPIGIYGKMSTFGALPCPCIWWHVLGAFLVFLGSIINRRIRIALSCRPLVFLGKLSYDIYLMHLIILRSYTSYLFLKLYCEFEIGFSLAVFISGISSIILIIIVSIVFNYSVKKIITLITKPLKQCKA